TRPETMLGDGAVAVHPSDERYAPIVGKLCEIPVGPKEHRRLIPIITDMYPDPDFGSGAVKITGAHDFNDYGVAKRNGIPCYRLMDTKAQMRADGAPYAECAAEANRLAGVPDPHAESGFVFDTGPKTEDDIDRINLVPDEYRGLDRFECRKRVVAAITAEGLAVTTTDGQGNPVPLVEAKKIMQPFGDRSKVVIEPMLTDQWFVDAAKLAVEARSAVADGRTKFAPENWSKTYFQWLDNIEPWCISRQLWWGHQIPVWYGPSLKVDSLPPHDYELDFEDTIPFCGVDFASAAHNAIESYYRPKGFEFSGVTELESWSALESVADLDGKIPFVRDPDVLDTWFSSALWPFSTLGWPDDTAELKKYYPTAVLSTGFDIIFFWVARMMMMGLHFMDEVPFRDVYIHALVRDDKGRKMSKSLGNIIDPLTLIDQYGADAVRMTLTSMAAMVRDLKLDVSRVEGYRNFATKLWNAARFTELNGCARDPGFDPAACRAPVNRWIVGETARLRASVDAALTAYRFNDAANALYAHVWGVYCDWYLEFAKPLLQGEDDTHRAETRACAAWALDQLLALLHPIMPFVTEELWRQTGPRATPLIHADWPALDPETLADPQADADLGWTIAAIEAIRSARAEMNVPPAAQLELVAVGADEAARARLAAGDALIRRLARLSAVAFADAPPKGALSAAVSGATLCLPLAGVIDVEAERARLRKAAQKAEAEIKGIDAKLANAAFLAKAPEAVVDEQRARRAAAAFEAERLGAALARLAEIA
ncbi:MAG: valine--tRNA ligase, partial [Rubrimonas sp.]